MMMFTENSAHSSINRPCPGLLSNLEGNGTDRHLTTRIIGLIFIYLIPGFLVAMPLGCSPTSEAGNPNLLRIGYQKWGTYSILKASGTLDSKMREFGLRVEWVEFPSGPSLLEALNAGSIDLGHAGDSPPLFAQAAGVPFKYVATSSSSPESSAIAVRNGSEIHKPRDLQGKRIGFVKGSSAHTLVIRVLEKAGLTVKDVEVVYLAPADGRAALEGGGIDAWSIWDPYLSAAEESAGVRRLLNGQGYVAGREYYFAENSYVEKRPEVIRAFLTELTRVKDWAKERPGEINRMLAEQTGIALGAVEKAESRRNRYNTGPLTPKLIAEQQAIADRYVELGLLPHRIDVQAAVANISFAQKE
jgi:sulfonate transport system substrate-binding protein